MSRINTEKKICVELIIKQIVHMAQKIVTTLGPKIENPKVIVKEKVWAEIQEINN